MGHNIGTTCFCIALSNFLCNKRRESTAYIELNATAEIQSLSRRKSDKEFVKNGITFFPKVTLSELPNIIKLNYNNYIIDFGVPNVYTYSELKRCNYRFALISYSPWKEELLSKFLLSLEENQLIVRKDIILLGNPGIKEKHSIPFFSNPFQITSECFGFFDELLDSVIENF